MNALLNREFLAPEVEKALKQMHPMTAPSPHSIPPFFYQHFSPIVVCIALNFLNHGIALPKFHETHIVLIPKTKNLEGVTDSQPISLCNVASKVVAN